MCLYSEDSDEKILRVCDLVCDIILYGELVVVVEKIMCLKMTCRLCRKVSIECVLRIYPTYGDIVLLLTIWPSVFCYCLYCIMLSIVNGNSHELCQL